jgi:putative transcriptional regulator
MAVHGCASLSEIEILDGVYLSMGRENLDQIVLQTFRPFKFFSGYSGWTAEQLETEVRAGGWLSIEAKKDQIYGDCDELWKQVCDEVGRKIMLPSTDHSSPHDPSLN